MNQPARFVMVGGFGSIVSGWLFDVTGSYDAAFLTFLGLLIPGVVLMIWLPEPGRQSAVGLQSRS